MKPEIPSQYLLKIVRYLNNKVSGEWSQKAWKNLNCRLNFEWNLDNLKDVTNIQKILLQSFVCNVT